MCMYPALSGEMLGLPNSILDFINRICQMNIHISHTIDRSIYTNYTTVTWYSHKYVANMIASIRVTVDGYLIQICLNGRRGYYGNNISNFRILILSLIRKYIRMFQMQIVLGQT